MPGDQLIHLNYMKWNAGLEKERPYQLVSEDLPELYGIPRQNFEIETGPHPHLVEDIRLSHNADFDTHFDLDKHGFTFVRQQFPDIDFRNEQDVETRYKPLVEKMLKDSVPGADEVVFFQWRLRENRRTATTEELGNIHVPTDLLVPAHFVHLDQTLKTAVEYVEEKVPVNSPASWALHEGRLRILNVWKPLNNPVYDCPLALCDGGSIQPSDLIVCDNITKAKIAELFLPLYNADSKWYYLSEQTPDEVTIMKIVDSDEDVEAPCCPHSAFDSLHYDPDSPPRRSIEMRALVYTRPPNTHELSSAVIEASVQKVEELLMQKISAGDDVVEQGKLLMEVQSESLAIA